MILTALSVITAATDILNFLPYALKIIIYTAAALLLGFAIYNTVIFIKSGVPKTKVDTLMHKTQIGGKIADNDMFRTVFFTYISFAINAGFAFIKGVAGWMTSSIWLIMLSAYYLILCIIKMTLLQSARKMRFAEDENEKKLREWTAYGHCGAMLMMPLCEILQITVNDLLTGERVSEDDYQKKAEENMMNLMKENEENKKQMILSVICGVITIIAVCALVVIAAYIQMPTIARIAVIISAFLTAAIGIGAAVMLEIKAGYFECPHCKALFVPTINEYVKGAHTLTKRRLTCPACGKTSMCKHRIVR